jgi:hypothetical protein
MWNSFEGAFQLRNWIDWFDGGGLGKMVCHMIGMEYQNEFRCDLSDGLIGAPLALPLALPLGQASEPRREDLVF